jgi:hypothetical protein
MFLCEKKCAKKYDIGFMPSMSHGPCEGCGQTALCIDVRPGTPLKPKTKDKKSSHA